MASLFDPFEIRGLRLRNRIVMAPMNQWSAGPDGKLTEWHFVHFGSRAVGGVGLILIDGTSVASAGRTTPRDLGIWEEGQIGPLARMTAFCAEQGAACGVQICYAGRRVLPGGGEGFDAKPVAPSPIPFKVGWETPRQLARSELPAIVDAFAAAARRAARAGFRVVEVQACHGYLVSSFLSPLTNKRADEYGGDIRGRARLGCEVVEAVRAALPEEIPLFVRISADDLVEGGNTVRETTVAAAMMRDAGADVMHVSGGGIVPQVSPMADRHAGYLVPLSETIRREVGVPTVTVGLIRRPEMADEIVRSGRADLVALGRELLRDPYWPLRAGRALRVDLEWPRQYGEAKP